jgi:flap endonuclease-1
MGIKNLTKLLQEIAPEAIKEQKMEAFLGRVIAIDASMCIYQVTIKWRVIGHSEGNGI